MNEQLAIRRKLHDNFVDLRLANPAFSLRAYARRLQISPSAVSEILQGKRRISKKLAQKILLRACKDPKEAQKILSLFAGTKQEQAEAEAAGPSASLYSVLPIDQFQTIASWHHFAIHSLIDTKGFRAEPAWIAKRLGIRAQEAEAALERLERVGMIEWDRKKKKVLQKEAQFSTPQDVANAAVRSAHREDLEMAGRKLEEIAVELREFTSITMGIDAKKIPEAKLMIRQFRDQLSNYLESGTKTEIYRMCLHFYPLSRTEDPV